ncbi:hypothetical protein [Schlesneria paludicola]|uniref:hypothetical protein n=1 Tax=Schlesneria paludicola TaxID=360056 RepID=UPI00029B43A9|nr:hypothetical protein [Schlesneria paludicola]
MSAFVWKHGVTADDARRLIQMKLAGDGVAQHVTWNGNRFTASVGWGFILKVVGEITQEVVRLDQISGPMTRSIITKSRDELASLFPDGYELTTTEDAIARR